MSKRKKGSDPPAGDPRVIRARLEPDDTNSHHAINNGDCDDVSPGREQETRDCASCHKHFQSVEAYKRHHLIKKVNKTARVIAVRDFSKYKHIILCPRTDCCFSSSSKGTHKIHLHTHGIAAPSPGGSLLVINIGSDDAQQDPTLSAYQCRICCAVMSTEKSLRRHQASCRGKYLFTCGYCNDTFKEREAYTRHLEREHFPDTAFEITGVFVGRKKKIMRKRGSSSYPSTERSIVMLRPGITSITEIFSEAVNSGIRRLLEWEIAAHGRISARIVVNSILSKDNGDEVG